MTSLNVQVSPLVVVPKLSKLNKIRTCVDMHSLKKPFIRERLLNA